MNPAIIHADGTECLHPGSPQASEDGPHCPAGQLVTHVRFNGRTMTFDEAQAAFLGLAEAMAKAIAPAAAAMNRLCGAFGEALQASPALRMLAAAAAEAEEGGRQ